MRFLNSLPERSGMENLTNPDPTETKRVQQQSSLSNQIEAEASICSTQAPTISQQSSSSSQDGVREMSRVSQTIAAEERISDVNGWREDEKVREEEKQMLGFDSRKEGLLYQKDMGRRRRRGGCNRD